jgi:hypothetical protein
MKKTLPFLLFATAIFLSPTTAFANDDICASVRIEIRQELTLERQAFDAHLRINNGFDRITLENVGVDVSFSDEDGNSVLASSDPDNTDALFFIRIDTLDQIDDVEGNGTVLPSSSADIRWLIIPSPRASGGLEQGKLYYVGATLTYSINGEEYEIEVSPDYIFVKPLPELTLDYFLPFEVYGDDAFTPDEVEPVIPFTLGVRVSNNGSGTARNIRIDSAQPEIIENRQGLLVGFAIEGTEVNGEAVAPTLLADFGEIGPDRCGVARWVMTCSLSGRFEEFEAEFSHSDELGGELTSLIPEDGINTHRLVRDVLVDLPGRDGIRDFLAKDGNAYKVFESEKVDTAVSNQSAGSGLTGSGDTYTLSVPITAGFMYVQLPDPYGGEQLMKQVIRSDGKIIREENAWLSKTRDADNNWMHSVNLFDTDTTDTYTIIYEAPGDTPQAPEVRFIPDHTTPEGEPLSFIVEASDPNGTVPMLSAATLPAGASFTDNENGAGTFEWTPRTGQAGRYKITFTASDGELAGSRRAAVVIYSDTDTDGDGLPDDWENAYFGSLDKDGTSDSDGDGVSDLDEYEDGTNPSYDEGGNPVPGNQPPIAAAAGPDRTIFEGGEVELDASASSDPDPGDTLAYLWTQASGPEVTLSDSASVQPTFTAPEIGPDGESSLIFDLEVTDTGGLTDTDELIIEIMREYHSADYNPPDHRIGLSELLRVIQFYNTDDYHCDHEGEDGYAVGHGDKICVPHSSDYYFYNPDTDTTSLQDWGISLSELLRLIQFYNSPGYHADPEGEDGFAPDKSTE